MIIHRKRGDTLAVRPDAAAPAVALAAATAVALAGCASSAAAGGASVARSAAPQAGSGPVSGSISAAAGTRWRAYHNRRYGFEVQFPVDFTAGSAPADGHGQTFRSADGRTEEIAIARPTPAGATPARAAAPYATDLQRRGELTSTHTDSGASTFTVTGTLYGGRYVEYVHGIVTTRATSVVIWSYPKTSQHTVRPWAHYSATTLRPGPN